MNKIDKLCIKITNGFCICLSYILYPFKYILCFIPKIFERNYSFCFLFSLILLLLPSIAMLTIMIDYSGEISKARLSPSYYLTLVFLGLNIIMIFFIYTAYQEHSIPNYQKRKRFSSRTLSQKLRKYFCSHKKIAIFAILIIGDVVISAIAIMMSNKKKFLVRFDIVKNGLLFGSIILLVFGCLNIVIYLLLLVVLYCTVNHSCICFLCCSSEKERFDRDIFFDKLPLYIQKILSFYKFFGIFDYHILLTNTEMYSSQSNENLNNNAVTIDDQKEVKL